MNEEKLLTLLKKKRGFFEAILELTETELHLPLEEWITTLKKKKGLLCCVDRIDEEIESFKDSFEVISQEVGEEIEKIKEVIQEILYLDSLNQEKRKKELSNSP